MNDGYVPVVGFEKYYLINKCGSIISLRNKNGKRGKELKQYKDKDGYMRVRLYGDNKSIWIGVHKVVAMTFLENPYNYKMVNHKNYDRDDNRVENLEWCNQKENVEWSKDNYNGANHISVIRIDKMGNKVKYHSISQASRDNSISIANICYCCKGKRKTAGGYKWEYEITEVGE